MVALTASSEYARSGFSDGEVSPGPSRNRGSHYRSDFPYRDDDDFAKHSIAQKSQRNPLRGVVAQPLSAGVLTKLSSHPILFGLQFIDAL